MNLFSWIFFASPPGEAGKMLVTLTKNRQLLTKKLVYWRAKAKRFSTTISKQLDKQKNVIYSSYHTMFTFLFFKSKNALPELNSAPPVGAALANRWLHF